MSTIDVTALNGFEAERLHLAILDAFNPDSFKQALRFKLNRKLQDITIADSFVKQVFAVIEASQEDGWTEALIAGLRSAKAGNIKLRLVAETFGIVGERTTPLPEGRSLEKIIRDDGGFADVLTWTAAMAAHQRRVCRVELPLNSAVGTGFLVGPDLVLTNHHVMAAAIGDKAKATDFACRFDYAAGPAGTHAGNAVALAADWHVASSPPSAADEAPERGPAGAHELDYCLVRLGVRIGDDERGWIAARLGRAMPAERDILLLLQHPAGLPAKLTLGAVLAPNETRTRLRHDANTLAGASGSPCFDARLDLVGLHHAGDPLHDKAAKPKFNQAIPIGLILGDLANRKVERFWRD